MQFNKEKFSKFVMDRPYLGEIKNEDLNQNEKLFKHSLDKAGCGDSYEISIKLDQNNKIIDAKYITYGCGYAQATCCALIECIINNNIQTISTWTEKNITEQIESIMGEYPVHKKAYMFFAKELIDGICLKALGKENLVSNVAKN